MSGASPSRMAAVRTWKHPAADLLLFVVMGLAMAELGPYRTGEVPQSLLTAYWLLAVIGTGLGTIAVERALAPRIEQLWLRILLVSLAVTPPATLYIYALNALMLDLPRRWWLWPELAWQVLVVMVMLVSFRTLLWRRVIQTRTLVMPPLPDAERRLRMRLSARRRTARLIALQAEDHYVRVHTDQGSELVAMRFADALVELERAHGHRLHRSWWAAGDAIEAVRWSRGSGEARLAGGLTAPISRAYAATLKTAGWR